MCDVRPACDEGPGSLMLGLYVMWGLSVIKAYVEC